MASTTSDTTYLYGENIYLPLSVQQQKGLSKKEIQASFNAVNMNVNFKSMPFIRIIKMLDENRILGGFNLIKTS
jgi:hypothetical protein